MTLCEQLAERLGGSAGWNEVAGVYEGVAITFREVNDEDLPEPWIEIDAELPILPLVLLIRPHGKSDAHDLARGDLVDILVGDTVFDRAFLIEGAPAKAIVRLLDRPAREQLLRWNAMVSYHVRSPGAAWSSSHDAMLHFHAGRIYAVDQALAMISFVARLAARTPEAVSAAQAESASSPYRGDGSDVEREIDMVRAARHRRLTRFNEAIGARIGWFGIVAVVITLVLAAVFLL